MMYAVQNAAICCKVKVDSWFKRVFKEEAGGAELIATLVIVGIVLILAFAFKQKLTELVKGIWNSLVVNGTETTTQQDVTTTWN